MADSAPSRSSQPSDDFRTERDSMGEVRVPAAAYYAAQTQRAVENFPVSGQTLHPSLISAIGSVKYGCAVANRDLGKLTGSGKSPLGDDQVTALLDACAEVVEGRHNDQFPIDVYQTGSGTSSNMNANEVIANRAIEIAGGDRFADAKPIHPNDHVNMGQSTNDTFPTAIHVAGVAAIHTRLRPALARLREALRSKADAWAGLIKIGRTHLADATPLTLGQEFGGFTRQAELSVMRVERASKALRELPVGGTAVGSGINTHPQFARRVVADINRYFAQTLPGNPLQADATADRTQPHEFADVAQFDAATGTFPDDALGPFAFVEAADHFEANADRDGIVECHGQLKAVATTLFNLANDIRWLGSGPRCGFYEVKIPDLQPGSSIMPGKVNPVMCESLMQAAARVVGHDGAITLAGAAGGNFQLNIMMPMMGQTLLESITLLAGAVEAFTANCIDGLEPNAEKCESFVEQSLSMVTSLNPHIGYERASALAKEAFKTGKTIRQLCREQDILPEQTLAEALDPMSMTQPQA